MDWYKLDASGALQDEACLASWAANTDVCMEPYWLLAHAMGYPGFGGDLMHLPVMLERQAPAAGRNSRFELMLYASSGLPALVARLGRDLARFQLDAPRVDTGTSTPFDMQVAPAISVSESTIRFLGVIDDGFPFAHPNLLLLDGRPIAVPRIIRLWDQGGHAGQHWTTSGVPFGAALPFSAMRRLINRLDERSVYRAAGYKQHMPAPPHGCGVTHLFAGAHVSLPDRSRLDFSSTAPWPILAVQLPKTALADTAGAWLGFYALHALRYIVKEASRLANRCGRPWHAIVNLSYGSTAGPHDGTSMFEQAIDELVGSLKPLHARLDVVLAAGNAKALSLHARRTIAAGRSGEFRCSIPPDNPRESYVEFWLPAKDDQGNVVTPSSFRISLRAPGGSVTDVDAGSAVLIRNQGDTRACGGVVFAHRVAQGTDGTMVLLMLRPTVADYADRAPHGLWTVTVQHRHARSLTVHARVERNDMVGRRRRPQQARFVIDPLEPGHVTGDESLSHCAHGRNVVVAGAVRHCDSRVTSYSSSGWAATGRRPDWFAPGDFSPGLPGVTIPGWHAGEWTRMSGTSIAAPWVARWLAAGGRPEARRPTYGDRHGVDTVGPPNWLTIGSA